ncbi:MAG: hypothetical protein LBT47_03250, partial [Deltaproteobacteria bacterium]|nr:hypothetical protein [Deltaproteobacteria bacterium]
RKWVGPRKILKRPAQRGQEVGPRKSMLENFYSPANWDSFILYNFLEKVDPHTGTKSSNN